MPVDEDAAFAMLRERSRATNRKLLARRVTCQPSSARIGFRGKSAGPLLFGRAASTNEELAPVAA
jgi:hypothetical protein